MGVSLDTSKLAPPAVEEEQAHAESHPGEGPGGERAGGERGGTELATRLALSSSPPQGERIDSQGLPRRGGPKGEGGRGVQAGPRREGGGGAPL